MFKFSRWQKFQRTIVSCLLVLFTLLVSRGQAEASSYRYYAYPQGDIGLTKPTIGFTFVSMDFSPQFDSLQMKLDNIDVQGTFDKTTMSYSFTPTDGLKPGKHSVDFFVKLGGYEPLSKSWTFNVTEQAVGQLPSSPTPEQAQGIQAVNDYRKLFGLQPLTFNANLTASAKAHAQYLANNQVDGQAVSLHVENESKKGYTGSGPMLRAVYAGYHQDVGEDVSYGMGSLTDSIDGLFDAPYHRTPFLMPNANEIGLDREGKYVVMEFGLGKENSMQLKLTVSPVPGDNYVPVDFDGHEAPDPLRGHGGEAQYPVGYPLLASVSGWNISKVMLDESSLIDDKGNPVKIIQNTPNSDSDLQNEVMLIPVKPLLPDSRYTAHVKVSFLEDGKVKSLEKTWSFRTEPAATVGKSLLHADAEAYLKQTVQSDPVSHVATFGLDDNRVKLDGISLPMRMKPLVIDGSSYLWIRDLAGALGATVTWNDVQKAAIYSKQGRSITFYTNRNAYAVSGTERSTETPAQLHNGSTLIPVRLLSEVLGAKVEFNEANRMVKITY